MNAIVRVLGLLFPSGIPVEKYEQLVLLLGLVQVCASSPDKAESGPGYYTPAQAAQVLGVSVGEAQRLFRAGVLHGKRIGSGRRGYLQLEADSVHARQHSHVLKRRGVKA